VRFHFFVPIKRTEILFTRSGPQCNRILWWPWLHPDPVAVGGGAYITLANPFAGFLRGPTCRERREQRRDGNKEEGGEEVEMEKRGEEGEGRDGSLHPLEFSKVGAYVHHSPGLAAANALSPKTWCCTVRHNAYSTRCRACWPFFSRPHLLPLSMVVHYSVASVSRHLSSVTYVL